MIKTISTLFCLTFTLATPVLCAPPSADYTEPITGMEFVTIPGGTFVMGADDDTFSVPTHEVTIEPFLFGRYEVTYEQYAKFCTDTGRLIPSDNGWGMGSRPIVGISWDDAVAFTEWLSAQTGRQMRLPSEAEWEYAARAGANTKYPWGDEIGMNNANCKGCGSQWDYRMTAPVGSFAPNGFGLYDMVGNAYEWCLDLKHDNYVGAPADGTAWLENPSDSRRINRGGSWYQRTVDAEVTSRCWEHPDVEHNDHGFRVLME